MSAARQTASPTPPRAMLRKAACIEGRHLRFRDARPEDAAFILRLRSDPVKGAHLSATSSSLADQIGWLQAYAGRSDEAYFIIESLQAEPGAEARVGTVRLYDARASSFCWGSWILSDTAPANAAVESALMVYAYGLDHLGFGAAHFSVNVDNARVCAFHERFGAQRVGNDGVEIRYTLGGDAIRASMARFGRFLPDGVRVLADVHAPGPTLAEALA